MNRPSTPTNEDSDDDFVGRILSRREALMVLGAAGSAFLAACAPRQPNATATTRPTSQPTSTQQSQQPTIVSTNTPSVAPSVTFLPDPTQALALPTATSLVSALPTCVVVPEMTEGPYFVDERLNRSDIRGDTTDGAVKEGAPLQLTIRVSQVTGNGCAPFAGAWVDIWHCDALGVYSDARDRSFNTQGKNFLRGYQVTDTNGIAKFTTIYPGWYQGRAVHIHFKVRNDPTVSGNGFDFTAQFFFDENLTEQVYQRAPYSSKGASGRTRNERDGIFRGGGNQLILSLNPEGQGYAGSFDLGIRV
jgi:protocatechuate 3,4-dioxygenase beta subunit